jgi:hypothetical protein
MPSVALKHGRPTTWRPQVSQLVQTRASVPARTVASIALAAALIGGVVGGAVQALSHASPGGAPIVSARDQLVLQAAHDWQARYRQMFPTRS